MIDFSDSIGQAFGLLFSFDKDLWEIVGLSLYTNISAVLIACAIGLPLAALLATSQFKGRTGVLIALNALLGLPPVVVGLWVYVLLSASGPFAPLKMLYTPGAMILAQVILITPLITALSERALSSLYEDYKEQLKSLGASRGDIMNTLIWDGRFQLLSAIIAGFGRALSEVGAVMIVGGNINHLTRIMTTAIALETSKGNLALAMGLGFILIFISIVVSAILFLLNQYSRRYGYG